MKMAVTARSHEEMLKTHPLADIVEGWYFRLWEASANVWCVEGCDRLGRRVYQSGHDDAAVLRAAADDARAINTALANQKAAR
jgi:hypothetical protein